MEECYRIYELLYGFFVVVVTSVFVAETCKISNFTFTCFFYYYSGEVFDIIVK